MFRTSYESNMRMAISDGGQAECRKLVTDLGLPKTPTRVALTLVALLALVRLQPYRASSGDGAEANHLLDFHSLLKFLPGSRVPETVLSTYKDRLIKFSGHIRVAD